MSNAIYLIILGVLVGLIWYNLGLAGVWTGAEILIGLGFVIFIHELGHFLAAKWCDVHVQTFSIGFGPALPGCSFQRGETTYKIGVLPLGGYVNMVGEGPEADEDENYPRSFKNKTVGQRMLIISAGVIMNVLLGCVLFIVVYYYHGVPELPAVVGRVDPASPMWVNGIPSGALITDIDGLHDPVFTNLQVKVALSSAGEKLPFTVVTYNEEGEALGERTVELLPRRAETDPKPVVGVAPPQQLRLISKQPISLPATRGSAAAAARPLPVEPDEVVVAATDPDNPENVTELKREPKSDPFGYQDLARRVRALEGKKMVVHVRPANADKSAKPIAREAPLEGFQFNDTIVGCTQIPVDPAKYNPFLVRELPRDPRHPGDDRRDPFVFHNHLRRLAGLPMIVQVRRGNPDHRDEPSTGPLVNLFVPPAYHVTFGLRMKMGKVAGIREDSPAAGAGVQKGDELIKVVMKDEQGTVLYSSADLDPERLPDELARAATKRPGKKTVMLTVRREPSESNPISKDVTLEPVEWDQQWDNDQETPIGLGSPLAVPQLGVAYWVLSQIVEVNPGSSAAEADLKKEDTINAVGFKEQSPYTKKVDWKWSELEWKRDGVKQYDRWAQAFQVVQFIESKEVKVRVNRPGEEMKEMEMTATEDTSWPLVDRGISLRSDYTIQKADNFGHALVLGARETRDWIGIMYGQLKSLLSGRISFTKSASGPLGIMQFAFGAAQSSTPDLLRFLAIISINLAVVNFLPIPILDGGHMVFLIYEKLRGRPPTENVKVVATYIGLAVILLLLVVVTFQDFRRLFGI